MEYKELAIQIVDLLGGKDNITNVMHCVTRLRFYIKDDAKTNMSKIQSLDGVIKTQIKNNQY